MKKITIKFLPFILGVYSGAAIFIFIDAWISVSLINMDDPSTWPNIHPWFRIYFIPVIGTFFAVISSCIEIVRSFLWENEIRKKTIWFLLGFSYTTILSFFSLGRILPTRWAVVVMGVIFIFLNPFLLHYKLRTPKNRV